MAELLLELFSEEIPARMQARAAEDLRRLVTEGLKAPEQAIAGFVKSAGLKSIKDATVVKDEKKGDFYVVRSEKPGRTAKEIVGEVVPAVAGLFPWP